MNNTLIQAEKWLKDLGIRTQSGANHVSVNRDDMVNLINAKEEGDNYTEVLKSLKSEISTKLFWGAKDDNNMYLESF